MSAIDDLNAAIATLQANAKAASDAIAAELQAIKNASAANDPGAIGNAIANIKAVSDSLAAAAASVNPPAAPAAPTADPAPAPSTDAPAA